MKKITSIILVLVMCLSFAIPALAKETSVVEIIVESEEEMLEFIDSPQYDRNKVYSFIILDGIAMRSLCPNCHGNNYKGGTEITLGNTILKQCPHNGLVADWLEPFKYYVVAKCSDCGYKDRMPNPYEIRYRVSCYSGTIYWAKDGQTMQGGYEIHECKSTWNLP